jgi:tetratricopeptide (TPR) repeat protein
MRLLCKLRQRAYARAAVRGDSVGLPAHLAKHLKRCEACHQEWSALERLTVHLAQSLESPEPTSSFQQAVWDRIKAPPAPPERAFVRFAPAAALLAFVTLLCILPWTIPPTKERSASLSLPMPSLPDAALQRYASAPTSRTSEAAKSAAPKALKPTRKRNVQTRAKPSPRATKPESRRSRRPRPSPRYLVRGAKERPSSRIAAADTKSPVASKIQWTTWGAWYEASGDYRLAAAAYRRSLEEKNDPSVEFAAGRAAECAGDLAEALDSYSRILNQTSGAKAAPEKGTLQWKDHLRAHREAAHSPCKAA